MEWSHSITDLPHQDEINRHKPVKHVRSHEYPTGGKAINDEQLPIHRTRSPSSNLKHSLLHLTSCALLKRKPSRTSTSNSGQDQSSMESDHLQSPDMPISNNRAYASSPSVRKSRHTQRAPSPGPSTHDDVFSLLSLRRFSEKKKKKKLGHTTSDSSDPSVANSPPQYETTLITDDLSSMLITNSSRLLRKEISSSVADLMGNASESVFESSMKNTSKQQALRHILSMPTAPIDRTIYSNGLSHFDGTEMNRTQFDLEHPSVQSPRPSNEFTWCYETPLMTENDDRLSPQLEIDEKPMVYRQQFLCEHFNWYGISELYGPVVISYKYFLDENKQRSIMGIIRTRQRTSVETLIDLPSSLMPIEILRQLCDQCCINDMEYFDPILSDGTQDLLIKYDESLVSNQHKFGIIYQRENQSTEEDLFSNESHCTAMETFLNLIGTRVKLKDFRGFRGGLDVKADQTGTESIYEEYHHHEIMFHVSTLLPHSKSERQQLERKRHIGNDIVAIIFQEKETNFNPEWIASQFLHVYMIITPLETDPIQFKVTVIHRDTVPNFGPTFQHSNVFPCDRTFKDWLLTKLINAELAACRSSTFQKYQERTKLNLFENLYRTLHENNRPIMDYVLNHSQYKHECDLQQQLHRDDGPSSSTTKMLERHTDSSIFGSVRRRFIAPKLRSPTTNGVSSFSSTPESKSKSRSVTLESKHHSSKETTKTTGKFSSLKTSTIRTEKCSSGTDPEQIESIVSQSTTKVFFQPASPLLNEESPVGQCTMFHFNRISADDIDHDHSMFYSDHLQSLSKEELIKLIEALQQQHSMRLAEKDHDHVKILQQLESQTTKINLGNSL